MDNLTGVEVDSDECQKISRWELKWSWVMTNIDGKTTMRANGDRVTTTTSAVDENDSNKMAAMLEMTFDLVMMTMRDLMVTMRDLMVMVVHWAYGAGNKDCWWWWWCIGLMKLALMMRLRWGLMATKRQATNYGSTHWWRWWSQRWRWQWIWPWWWGIWSRWRCFGLELAADIASGGDGCDVDGAGASIPFFLFFFSLQI